MKMNVAGTMAVFMLAGMVGVWAVGAQPGAPVKAGASATSKHENKETVGVSQPARKPQQNLKFKIYDRPYFVKNTYEPQEARSFAILKSLSEFDNVFGVGMVMGGKRPEVDAQTFASHVILAAVKRGPMCTYQVESVQAKSDGVEVRYTVNVDKGVGGEFAVPLIIGVPKGNYASITFVENGKPIKVLK
jgi:hypothetical protein